MAEAVLYTKQNGVATVRMNLPEKMNSLTVDMVTGLTEAMLAAKKDSAVRCVVLTGSGRAFCAGGDIAAFGTGMSLKGGIDYLAKGHHIWSKELYEMDKPTVAAVNGFAMGAGFGIAMLCDMIVAAKTAKFALSFSNVGLCTDYGVAYTLPRIVGMTKAKELFYLAPTLTADEAAGLGIVNQVVEDEALESTVAALAEKLANGPTFAYSIGKNLFHAAADVDFADALRMESYSQSMMFQTEDCKEAISAFFEKRKPNFQGK